jgi:hypothetical protein
MVQPLALAPSARPRSASAPDRIDDEELETPQG